MRFIILLISVIFPFYPVFADDTVNLTGVEKNKINISKPNTKIKGSLLIKDDELLQSLIDTQKKQDMMDIEALWKGTVENNKVIEINEEIISITSTRISNLCLGTDFASKK